MPHENINDAKVWLSYAQDDFGVARHLFNTYYPKPLSINAITVSKRQRNL